MLPTLGGRIQTRLVLLAVVGGIVTLIIGPLLPISAPLSVVYQEHVRHPRGGRRAGHRLGVPVSLRHAMALGEGLADAVRPGRRRSPRACWCGCCCRRA